MPPTLLIAALQEMVLGFLTARADDAIREWWNQKPVEAAIEATARVLQSEYDGLGAQLRDWARQRDVADVLVRFARGYLPAADVASTLLSELARVGFVQAPECTSAEQVLIWFFREFHNAQLDSEGSTYSTGFLHGQIKATAEEVKEVVRAGLQSLASQSSVPTLSSAATPSLAASAGEELPTEIKNAKSLIENGHPRSALELLRVYEGQQGDRSEFVRYEAAATRGNAFMQLGDPAEAEKAFRAGLELRPERPNALANVGLARLVQGDAEGALVFAEQALTFEANNASAVRLKIQALALQGQFDAAVALTPSVEDDFEREQLLGFVALKQDDGALAQRHYQAAHELKPEHPSTLARLAHAHVMVLQSRLRGTEHGPWGQLPADTRPLVDDALRWLDKAVAALERTDDRQELAQALFDRATLRGFLGDDRADADFTRGLELDRTHEGAVRQAASYWLTKDAADKAVPYLEYLRAAGKSSREADLLYARALLELKRNAEVESVLDAVRSDSPEQALEVTLVRFEGRLARHDWAGAERLLGNIPEEHRLDWKVAALTAELLGRQHKAEAAVALLKDALASVAPEHRWHVRLSLARQLLDLARWDEAAEEFKAVVGANAPPGMLRQYVSALYNADRLDECLSVCKAIRERSGFVPEVAEVEALAEAALGQLSESDTIYAELQRRNPDEPKWRLRRAFIALRKGDKDAMAGLLPSADEISRLEWHEGLEVAGLQSLVGDLRGSLETAYRVARAHPTEPQAQLRYVGVFFAADAILGDDLKATTAGPGTWVTIETDGQREVHELLEPNETPASRTQHRNDAFYTEVLGKETGQQIVLVDDSLGTVTATITEIRSKYVGLFQETLQTFNRTFPRQEGLRAFAFSDAEGFDPIKRSLTDRAEYIDKIMQQYASMPMPLSMLGKALGLSDIEVWEALAGGEAGRPVHVGLGTPDALKRYAELAVATTPLVFDATSLWALQRLELLDALPALGRELYVAQSVLDDLGELRTKRELDLRRPGDRMTLLVQGGELRRSMTPEEALRRGLKLIDQLIAWIRSNCKVVGVQPGPDQHRRTILEGLSRGAYDSILCARDHDGVLVNEDLRLRSFAETEFKRAGIASVHLVGGMLARASITQARHDEAIATAAEWNYEFISLNHATLMAAFRLDGLLVGRKVHAILKRLAEPTTDAGPVVVVSADFLRELMLGSFLNERVQAMLHALLGALVSRPDWRRVEAALFLRLNERLKLHPLALQTLSREIAAWKRARLIP